MESASACLCEADRPCEVWKSQTGIVDDVGLWRV